MGLVRYLALSLLNRNVSTAYQVGVAVGQASQGLTETLKFSLNTRTKIRLPYLGTTALQGKCWVEVAYAPDNIRQLIVTFGGDPTSVMVVGEQLAGPPYFGTCEEESPLQVRYRIDATIDALAESYTLLVQQLDAKNQ